MKPPSILIIDDQPNNFDVIEALLSTQDYQFRYAASGQAAITNLDAFQPDLILLDVMMPGMDGIETCQCIKAMPQWQPVPIIMVTALSDTANLADCLMAGADDFICKPVNGIELRARVHSMLRIKQQYDKIQSFVHSQENMIAVLESILNELSTNLSATLAHELNTPLLGILGAMNLLTNHLENMDIDEIREILGWANQSARRLESLTNKFRLYLELELLASQQQPIKFEQTSFSGAAIEANLTVQAQGVKRGQDLVFALEEADIALSERYLSILLHELVDNALKFSPPGKIINVRSQVVGQRLIISIHDLGQGMTAEQIAKIGPFMQFGRKTYEQQGTGMGLKIVQKIVELAGGQVSITSIDQQETTVNLTLPIVGH